MDLRTVIIIVAILVLGGVLFYLRSKKQSEEGDSLDQPKEEPVMMEKEPTETPSTSEEVEEEREN